MGFHPYGLIAIGSIALLIYVGIDYIRASRLRIDVIGLILTILVWLLFVSAFIRDEFNLLVVYSYSTVDMPLWLKISASWAGMAGSFVLWTLMMALISFIYKFYGLKRGVFDSLAYRGLLLITASIMILGIEVGAFETADVNYKIPAGASLNPLLRSFWILIHPLFTFAGYAFCVALALHVLLSSKRDAFWERLLAGLAWINLSIGIIAGAVWAYKVLGWGGYWAWDPVETAELVPWLALTAYFHAPHSVGEGGRRLSAALTGFFTFYSSFMTKAGASFTASVHTFEWTPKATLLVILHFLFGCAILALYLWRPGNFVWTVRRSITSISFALAWWSLIALSLVTFLGIFTPVVYAIVTGDLISVNIDYYNTYCAPLTYVFLVALVGCTLRERLSFRGFIYASLAITAASVAATLAGVPTSNPIADFLFPALLVSLASASYRLLADTYARNMRSIGASVLHVAIPILLLGVALNTTLDTSTDLRLEMGEPVETPYGVTLTYTGYEIRVSDWEIFYRGHLIPEGAYGYFFFEASDGENTYKLIIPVRVPFAYGCGSEPRTISKGLDDIYISIIHADFHNRLRNLILGNAFYGGNATADYVLVEVKYNPYIDLIWLGSALLVLGEIVVVSSLLIAAKRGAEV